MRVDGYLSSGISTSLRSAPSTIAATKFTLYITNGAAGTVSGGTGLYTFQPGTVTSDVFTGSGASVVMAVADRQASLTGSMVVTAGQRVGVQVIAGGTGTITASPGDVEMFLTLFE